MTKFTCNDVKKPLFLGDEYIRHYDQHGPVTDLVGSARDAARAFASIIARRKGRHYYCHHVRADTHTQDGRIHNFEAFIGRDAEGGGTVGHNIWLTVRVSQ